MRNVWTFAKENAPHLGLAALAVFVAVLYLSNHAYGATGDDAPLYLEMASRIAEGESLAYHDPIVRLFLGAGMEEEARSATPHFGYRIVDHNGFIAPTVQVGFAYLLGAARLAFGDEGQFALNPLLGVVTVVFLFLIMERGLRGFVAGRWVALAAAFSLALTPAFWLQAVYQPMTETSATAFATIAIYAGLRAPEKRAWLLVASVALGYATCIRTPTVLLASAALLPYTVHFVRNQSWRPIRVQVMRDIALKAAVPVLLVVGGFLVGYLPSLATSLGPVLNAGEPLTENLVTNQEHVRGWEVRNYFENTGKYRVGTGGLGHYKTVLIDGIIGLPLAGVIFLLAATAMLRRVRLFALVLFLWIAGTYFFYAGWTNPYFRYVLPAYPAIVGVLFGGMSILTAFLTRRHHRLQLVAVLLTVLLLSFVAVHGVLPQMYSYLGENPQMPGRSMSLEDWRILRDLPLPEDAVLVVLPGPHLYASTIAAATGAVVIKTGSIENVGRQVDLLVEAGYPVALWDDFTRPGFYEAAMGSHSVEDVIVYQLSFAKVRLTLLGPSDALMS